MPTIAEPYVEYGEWVLGKERYYKVPTICCRTWIDKEQNYWEWTAENGEVIDVTHSQDALREDLKGNREDERRTFQLLAIQYQRIADEIEDMIGNNGSQDVDRWGYQSN